MSGYLNRLFRFIVDVVDRLPITSIRNELASFRHDGYSCAPFLDDLNYPFLLSGHVAQR